MLSRKRFLEFAAIGGLIAVGHSVLPLNNGSEVAHADPESDNSLMGSLAQAINVRALVCGASDSACPTPRLLNNGMYALPASVLSDERYAVAAEDLTTWTQAKIDDSQYSQEVDEDENSNFMLSIDRKLMRQVGRPASLTMPQPGVFRFEVRPDDFGGTYDSNSGSRRSEIVARQRDGSTVDTVWVSFCLVLGDATDLSTAGRGIVHQWHSVDRDVGRTPVLFIDVANSKFTIRTCSSADLYGDDAKGSQTPDSGVQVVHYSTSTPGAGERTYVTLQATFGKFGHLNAWINGRKVVDTDTPIGYYTDLRDGSGRTILGYPHWGLYTTNRPDTQVVYIANPEWGARSLAERISQPLFVPDIT